MTRKIVVLGGGTGGTLAANRLARLSKRHNFEITVVDKDDNHLYQPGLLFIPFSHGDPPNLVRSRGAQLNESIRYVISDIDHVKLTNNLVVLSDGSELHYDVCIIATGAILMPSETEGLIGPGWGQDVFTFYDLTGALELRDSIAKFDSGRLVINVVDIPIKCSVAPLEFAFLADDFFTKANRRSNISITYATPLDSAFTKPEAARQLSNLLSERSIEMVTNFNTGKVDEVNRRLISFDQSYIDYDLLVAIPLHGGAEYVGRSPGLGDEFNFIPTNPATLQAKVADNIFVIGDAAGIPAPKAGSVAHFEGEVIVSNIVSYLDGKKASAVFDGHTNCFIETGNNKAILIDFNYDTEPLSGHFPGPFGLPLLKESRLNHLGKLAFEQFYWHVLLGGHDLPMAGSDMPMAGKHHLESVDGSGSSRFESTKEES